MHKYLAGLFIFSILCCTLPAAESDLIKGASPKLREFIGANKDAYGVLTNVLTSTFASKAVTIYYFYTGEESQPRCWHYYPDQSMICIIVRENQDVLDEYISLLYETVNTQNELQFKKLSEKATAGTISKSDFSKEILKLEHLALKKTRDLLFKLKLSNKKISKSYFYRQFVRCPESFDAFFLDLSTNQRNTILFYEQQYDQFRKANGS